MAKPELEDVVTAARAAQRRASENYIEDVKPIASDDVIEFGAGLKITSDDVFVGDQKIMGPAPDAVDMRLDEEKARDAILGSFPSQPEAPPRPEVPSVMPGARLPACAARIEGILAALRAFLERSLPTELMALDFDRPDSLKNAIGEIARIEHGVAELAELVVLCSRIC